MRRARRKQQTKRATCGDKRQVQRWTMRAIEGRRRSLGAKPSGTAPGVPRRRLVKKIRRGGPLAWRGGGPNVSRREAAHGAARPPRGHPRGPDLARTAGTAHARWFGVGASLDDFARRGGAATARAAAAAPRQASDFVLGCAIVGDSLAVCARVEPQRTRSPRLRSSRGALTCRPPVDRKSIPNKNWRGPSPRRAQHARGGHGTLISAAGGGSRGAGRCSPRSSSARVSDQVDFKLSDAPWPEGAHTPRRRR